MIYANLFLRQEWSRLGSQIVETTTRISQAEKEALELLRNEVNSSASQLRRNARIVDELDVTLAFANLAEELKLVRPTIREECVAISLEAKTLFIDS